MNDRIRARLQDALESAELIDTWARQYGKNTLESDRLVESAFVRQFEIIGEALRTIRDRDDSIEQTFPQIHEWIGLRNQLIHEYRDIDFDLLWHYSTIDIPEFIALLNELLGQHRYKDSSNI